ncbi:MAG TPA: hypothetical protein VE465_17735, partial [Streptosporangiaceae bacterium]|nr:hypothetical protein [Streptosporangiaceae bacterium]
TGNTETSVRLDDIVDVDPATGVTYVKQGVDKATEMALDVKSTGAVPPPDPTTRPMSEDED